jgi:phage baseplate assembly protein V
MDLFNEDSTREILKSLIKIGEVSSVNYANGTARVVFDDDDSIVSNDLPVLQTNTLLNKDHALPDVGEDVVCLFLPSGNEEGFILGAVYAGEVQPAETSKDIRSVTFSDGTEIKYDRAAHLLSVKIDGTTITANRENVNIDTPKEVNVKGGQTVNVEGGQTVNVKGGQTVNITGGTVINLAAPSVNLTMGSTTMKLNGAKATIEASEIEVKGALKVTGNMTTTGNITASGAVHGSNID